MVLGSAGALGYEQGRVVMRTSLLLIQPVHLQLHILLYHNYKDLPQELVLVNSIIRYFCFYELFQYT
jgi:hypothetical protein